MSNSVALCAPAGSSSDDPNSNWDKLALGAGGDITPTDFKAHRGGGRQAKDGPPMNRRRSRTVVICRARAAEKCVGGVARDRGAVPLRGFVGGGEARVVCCGWRSPAMPVPWRRSGRSQSIESVKYEHALGCESALHLSQIGEVSEWLPPDRATGEIAARPCAVGVME